MHACVRVSCRLILCCENLSKLIEPLRSRCLAIRVAAPAVPEVHLTGFFFIVVTMQSLVEVLTCIPSFTMVTIHSHQQFEHHFLTQVCEVLQNVALKEKIELPDGMLPSRIFIIFSCLQLNALEFIKTKIAFSFLFVCLQLSPRRSQKLPSEIFVAPF
jgi:hypothetical protein